VIARKIKKCKTDAGYDGLEWGNPDRPECTNLLTMYQAVTGNYRSIYMHKSVAATVHTSTYIARFSYYNVVAAYVDGRHCY
jgi:hypothetical protein